MTIHSFRTFALAVVIEAFCFIVVGYIALSPGILDPGSSMFSFTIFGLIGVLLYNSLESEARRIFLSFSGIAALLFFLLWFEHSSFLRISTTVLWFVLIGGLAFVAWRLLQPENIRNSLFLPLIIWLASWIAVYLVMTFLDVFIFGEREIATDVAASWFFLRGIGSGAILGLGTGVGFILTRMLVREKPSIGST
ncbi:MAG: hypothetical protein FJ215_05115 [Ignavibacteria bacterium]|nr:hypothetical protein [Ignavibacteria bacterium]